jgi:hypothetical protein
MLKEEGGAVGVASLYCLSILIMYRQSCQFNFWNLPRGWQRHDHQYPNITESGNLISNTGVKDPVMRKEGKGDYGIG